MPVKGQVGQEGRTKLQLRAQKGKFGVAGMGVGRPSHVVEEKRLEIMKEVISDADWVDIINTAKQQALQGERYARDWLSKYILGPAPERAVVQDNRSVNLDLSQLSDDQLEQLAQLIGHITDRGGTIEAQAEHVHTEGVGSR